ncbi:MAG: ROK family protein [Verrucomicrobiota bacterium]|nr:ROK family protein [Verrucomicrobiota bacterium]
MKKILVVDIGGTHVKLMISRSRKRKFDSGKKLSPKALVAQIKECTEDWDFDAISLGVPSPIENGHILQDPKHLGQGWVGFDFKKALAKPMRIINDAAMQALGSYQGNRMLFLGLGTGLGSTLIWGNNVLPLELGDLPYPGVNRIEDVVGKIGLDRLGRKKWEKEVLDIVRMLKLSFIADYVVLGGGNVKQMEHLPRGIVRGNNRNAHLGGCRLWQTNGRQPKWRIIS